MQNLLSRLQDSTHKNSTRVKTWEETILNKILYYTCLNKPSFWTLHQTILVTEEAWYGPSESVDVLACTHSRSLALTFARKLIHTHPAIPADLTIGFEMRFARSPYAALKCSLNWLILYFESTFFVQVSFCADTRHEPKQHFASCKLCSNS